MGEVSEKLRQQVLDWLRHHVPESRIEHILRVEQMAIDLAQIHGLDLGQAAQASLMHDLAKYFKPSRLLEMARRAGLPLDPVDEAHPHLLHADISALVAQAEFGVQDPEILAAIANHTLGRPGMDRLSCVVFLADSLEPERGDTPELNHLRQVSREDLTEAMWLTCDDAIRYLITTHRLIHPRTVLTRNWFLQQTRMKQKFTEPSTSLAANTPSVEPIIS